MAIPVICPGCDADYSVPENLLGKTIRCKKCGETVAVKQPTRVATKATTRHDDEERPRKAIVRRHEDDTEDRDFQTDKKRGGSSLILIGGIAFLLLAISAVGAIFLFTKEENEVVSNEQPSPRRVVDPAPEPEKKDEAKPGKPVKTADKKTDEKKPDEVKTEDRKSDKTETSEAKAAGKKADDTNADVKKDDSTKAPEKKPDEKPAKKDATSNSTSTTDRPVMGLHTAPGGSLNGLDHRAYRTGDMDPLTLAKVKKAAVYIFCESEGGAATGSGWFGIEPGLVFTNAHVLDMLAPNAPPPKNLKFFLNSGQPDQRMIPYSKIKILGVDRKVDIAVCQVINEPDLPTPLKVRPSLECTEGLGLNTVGFPGGARPGRATGSSGEPSVSIRRTTLTAFRYNDYGQIRRIQFEAAINQGNSGGAVVDAEGTVCTVVVEGMNPGAVGSTLSFGVPTENCFGLLAGRTNDLDTGIAYSSGDKVHIPIRIKCLDPLNRLQNVGIASWIGNPAASLQRSYRKPGKEKPPAEPGDRDYSEVMLKYDNKTKTATGEVILPRKPDGTVYWLQPFYSNPIVSRYYDPASIYTKTNEPAERIPTNISYRNAAGKSRVVTMSTAASRGEEAAGEGEHKQDRALRRFGLTVAEDVLPPDANDNVQAGKLRLRFLSVDMPRVVTGNSTQDLMPKILFARINEEVKKCGAVALVNKEGEIYKHVINTVNVPSPSDKYFIGVFTSSAMDSLDATSIKLPNKDMNPDETWTSTKDFEQVIQDAPPTDDEGKQIPGSKIPEPRKYRYQESRTYKYVGIRTREGRKEAMVLVEGKMSRAPGVNYGANGSIKGWAAVDLNTGVVLEATIERDFEIDTSSKGVKKYAYGVFVYKINRSAPN